MIKVKKTFFLFGSYAFSEARCDHCGNTISNGDAYVGCSTWSPTYGAYKPNLHFHLTCAPLLSARERLSTHDFIISDRNEHGELGLSKWTTLNDFEGIVNPTNIGEYRRSFSKDWFLDSKDILLKNLSTCLSCKSAFVSMLDPTTSNATPRDLYYRIGEPTPCQEVPICTARKSFESEQKTERNVAEEVGSCTHSFVKIGTTSPRSKEHRWKRSKSSDKSRENASALFWSLSEMHGMGKGDVESADFVFATGFDYWWCSRCGLGCKLVHGAASPHLRGYPLREQRPGYEYSGPSQWVINGRCFVNDLPADDDMYATEIKGSKSDSQSSLTEFTESEIQSFQRDIELAKERDKEPYDEEYNIPRTRKSVAWDFLETLKVREALSRCAIDDIATYVRLAGEFLDLCVAENREMGSGPELNRLECAAFAICVLSSVGREPVFKVDIEETYATFEYKFTEMLTKLLLDSHKDWFAEKLFKDDKDIFHIGQKWRDLFLKGPEDLLEMKLFDVLYSSVNVHRLEYQDAIKNTDKETSITGLGPLLIGAHAGRSEREKRELSRMRSLALDFICRFPKA